jgi:hypothetical protein
MNRAVNLIVIAESLFTARLLLVVRTRDKPIELCSGYVVGVGEVQNFSYVSASTAAAVD